MNKNLSKNYLKIGQAAQALGVSIDTLRRWEKAGKITAIRTPGGTRLYHLSALKKINPSVDWRIADFQAKSLSTEELFKKAENQTIDDGKWKIGVEDGNWTIDDRSSTLHLQKSTFNLLSSIVNKLLVGSAVLSVVTLLITSWITASYLTSPKDTRDFFKNNIASGLFSPFRLLAEEVVVVLDPTKAKELGFSKTSEVSLSTSEVNIDKSNVLAVTASPKYLEVNSDTQINGSLSVRDAINGLSLEATPSAGTIALNSGTTTLTVTKDALLDQDVSTTATPTFNTLNLSATKDQLVFQSGSGAAGTLTWTPTAARTITLPDVTTTLVGTDATQTLTNKTMSGSSNTFSSIPNSALSNSKVTVTAGTNMSGGGDVTLGSSITLSLASSPVISGVLSLADGTAAAPALTFTNDTNSGLYRIGSDTIGLITGGTATQGITIDASGNVGIGTITPSATLDLIGTFQYTDGNQAANKILASDASGNASWTTVAGVGGITGTGASGQVAFWNGTSTQTGSNNLWWDNTNSRLGIGTTSPSQLFQVNYSSANPFVVTSSGNVGIGTTTPTNPLTVVGNANITGTLTAAGNVGIGTTVPMESLHLIGNFRLDGSRQIENALLPWQALYNFPSSLNYFSMINLGWYHTCAFMSDGTAKCWGQNDDGEFGNGTTTNSSVPVSVSGLTNVLGISGGYHHTCAVLNDGTTKCWGRGSSGQLGDGSTTQRNTPVSVSGLTGAIAISTGNSHSCALLQDGTVKCWGNNGNGQLGDGSTTQRNTPVSVSGLTGAIALDLGPDHSCAVLNDGTAKCWGANGKGQLGDGSTTQRTTPVLVSGLSAVVAISGGGTSGSDSTCALLHDGTAKCWGANDTGQLGDGTITDSSTPVSVSGLTNAKTISLGAFSFACATLNDRTAKCWGANGSGELGDGTTTNSYTPVSVSGLTSAITISAGAAHACAILSDGTAKCWGANGSGRLGDGTTTNSSVPVGVSFLNQGLYATTGGNIGVGTTVPIARVQILGTGTGTGLNFLTTGSTNLLGLAVLDNGNVGIGNTNPGSALTVIGNVGIGTSAAGASLQVNGGGLFGWGTASVAGPTNGLGISGNVGIGTTTANSKLTVVGNAMISSTWSGLTVPTSGLFVEGNVGIGATTSSNKLDVWGNSRITGTLTVDQGSTFGGNLTLAGNLLPSVDDTFDLGSNTARWANVYIGPSTLHLGTSTSDEYTLSYDTTNNRLGFNVNGSGPAEIVMDSAGNVGIGTTSPSTKLHVASNVATNEDIAYLLNSGLTGVAGADSEVLRLGRSLATNESAGIEFNYKPSGNSFLAFTLYGDAQGSGFIQQKGGNVGIGTTNPTQLFSVGTGATSNFTVTSAGIVSAAGNISTSGVFLAPNGSASLPSYSFTNLTNAGLWTNGDGLLLTTGGTNTSGITVTGAGNVGIGTTSPGAKLQVNADASGIGAIIKANATTPGNIQEWQDSSGNILAYVTSGGVLKVDRNASGNYLNLDEDSIDFPAQTHSSVTSNWGLTLTAGQGLYLNSGGGSTYPINLQDYTLIQPAANEVALTVKGYSGQTADLQQWQNSAGTALAVINASGNIGIGTILPTAALQVNPSSGTTPFVVTSTGNVGIGRTNPGSALTVIGNVGIGTSAAGASLQVNGGGLFGWGTAAVAGPSNGLGISGNVGIGTTSPGAKLEVSGGSSYFRHSNAQIYFYETDDPNDTSDFSILERNSGVLGLWSKDVSENTWYNYINMDMSGVTSFPRGLVSGTITGGSAVGSALTLKSTSGVGTTDSIIFQVGNNGATEAMRVINSGNVGIGTTAPGSSLAVSGNGVFGFGGATSIAGPTNGLAVSGNVGIGTTSPTRALHVEGQCVTGDTLLAIAKTQNLNVKTQNYNSKLKTEEIEFKQIKDIKGGEYVLSLDEETGKIVPAKIKGLLDMGVKPVYKLTTEDGKTIRTTGNHPYLTSEGWKKVVYLSEGEEIAVLGTARKGENQNKTYQGDNQGNKGKDSLIAHFISLSGKPINNNQNYPTSQTGNREKGNPVVFYHDFTPLVKESPILRKPLEKAIPQIKETAISHQFAGREIKGLTTPPTNQATPILDKNSAINFRWPVDNFSILLQNSTVQEPVSSDISWAKIASIEYIGAEQVWDIEVEGTHNFVANGIVAHNTYISGNVGIGATTSSNKLDVWGNSRITGTLTVDSTSTFGGNFTLSSGQFLAANGTAALPSYSFSNLTNAGLWTNGDGLLLTTGGTNTSGLTVTGAGNVGIGTTAPSALLSVGSTSQFQVNSSGYALLPNGAVGTPSLSFTGDPDTGLYLSSANELSITTANSQAVVVDASGFARFKDGSATGPSITFMADIDSGLYRLSDNTIGLITGGTATKGLTIDGNGNVGIGTISPLASLYVTGNAMIGYSSGAPASLANGLAVSGNIGIGTTAPSVPLDVQGKGKFTLSTADGQYLVVTNGSRTINIGFNSQYNSEITGLGSISGVGGTGTLTLSTVGGTGDLILNSGADIQLNPASGSGVGIGEVAPGSKLAVSGNMTVGTSYDTTAAPSNGILIEGNVGIGTVLPTAALQVNATNSNPFVVQSGGNVGIGTTNPLTSLYVTGNAMIGYSSGAPGSLANGLAVSGSVGIGTTSPGYPLDVKQTAANDIARFLQSGGDGIIITYNPNNGGWFPSGTGGGIIKVPANTNSNSALGFSVANSGAEVKAMIIANTGNVGIGFTSPNALLHIGGANQTTAAYGIQMGSDITLYRSAANTLKTDNNLIVGGTLNVANGTASLPSYSFTNLTNAGLWTNGDGLLLTTGGTNTSGITVTGAGRVGIGTTAPGSALDIPSGRISVGAGASTMQWNGALSVVDNHVALRQTSSSGGTFMRFLKGAVTADGRIGYMSVGSDGTLALQTEPGYDLRIDARASSGSSGSIYFKGDGTGYVGIGTISPVAQLDLRNTNTSTGLHMYVGSSAGQFSILDNGNVGIGTTTPQTSLYVTGNAMIGYSSGAPASLANGLAVSGNVGIGTTAPASYLHVAGGNSTTNNIRIGSASGTSGRGWIGMDGDNMVLSPNVSSQWVSIAGQLTLPSNGGYIATGYGSNGVITILATSLDMDAKPITNIGNSGTDFSTSGGLTLAGASTVNNTLSVSYNGASTAFSVTQAGAGYAATFTGGNVGIGTTAPGSLLDISSTAPTFRMTDTTASAKSLLVTTDGNLTQFEEAGGSANDLFVLDLANARVGLGTTAPASRLEVQGVTTDSYAAVINSTATYPRALLVSSGQVGGGGTNYRAPLTIQTEKYNGTYGIDFNEPVSDYTPNSYYTSSIYSNDANLYVKASSALYLQGGTNGNININAQGTGDTLVDLDSNTDFNVEGGQLFAQGSSGNVGIGTAVPGAKLAVIGNVGIGTSAAGASLQVNGGGLFGWGTASVAGPTNGLGISGNVGIGTTSPGNTLDVVGGIRVSTLAGASATHVCRDGNNDLSTCSSDAEYAPMEEGVEEGDLVVLSEEPNPIEDEHAPFLLTKSTKAYDDKVMGVVIPENLGGSGEKKADFYKAFSIYGYFKAKVSTVSGEIKRGDYLTTSDIPGVAMKMTKPGRTIGIALEDFTDGNTGKIRVFNNLSFADPGNFLASLSLDDQGNLIMPAVKVQKLTLDAGLNLDTELLNKNLAYQTNALETGDISYGLDIKGSLETLAASVSTQSAQLADVSSEVASQSAQLAETKTHTSELAAQLASASAELAQTKSDVDQLKLTPPDILLATGSAQLANLKVTSEATVSGMLLAYQAEIQDNFKSLGQTTLGQTLIAGDLTVDGTMSINGNSLNTIGILYLQNSSLAGNIDLFNGKVTIDKNGNIVSQGEVTAASIITNKLTISNTPIATSSATLAASIGTATLPANAASVTIETTQISEHAKVFITPITTTDKVLSVTNIEPGISFGVSVLTPASEDINFNWWIVQTN